MNFEIEDLDIAAEMAKDESLIPIVKHESGRKSAQELFDLTDREVKQLRGKMRFAGDNPDHKADDALFEPIGSLKYDCVYNDYRLPRFVKNIRDGN